MRENYVICYFVNITESFLLWADRFQIGQRASQLDFSDLVRLKEKEEEKKRVNEEARQRRLKAIENEKKLTRKKEELEKEERARRVGIDETVACKEAVAFRLLAVTPSFLLKGLHVNISFQLAVMKGFEAADEVILQLLMQQRSPAGASACLGCCVNNR